MSVDPSASMITAFSARARRRYPFLSREERGALAGAAAASVADRRLPEREDLMIAGHVTMATLAGERLADRGGPILASRPAIESGAPDELALAEHLQTRLEPEERLAITLLATCGLRSRTAAAALNLTRSELRRLERHARDEAERHVLAHHDELICEPAELVWTNSPAAVGDAVRGHLARCRSCRREFGHRVWLVLGQAGRLELPLVALAAPPPAPRFLRRSPHPRSQRTPRLR
jgi:hypothetical protein